MPAYYQTNWFRALCIVVFMALLLAAYQWRVRHLHHEFEMTLEARVSERTRIAREPVDDSLLPKFPRFAAPLQTMLQLLPERPMEAKKKLGSAIEQTAGAITEGQMSCRDCADPQCKATIWPSARWERNSQRIQLIDLHSMSRLRAKRAIYIPFSGMRLQNCC